MKKINLSNLKTLIDSDVINVAANNIGLPKEIKRIEITPEGIYGIIDNTEEGKEVDG